MHKRFSCSAAFTLLEILLVTVLLSILISIVTPQFHRTFDNIQFKNFVLDVSALLRYAHERAILEKDTYRLRYLEDPGGCRLERSSPDAEGQTEFRRVRDRSGAVRLIPRNVRAQLDPPEIIFYPDGSSRDARWRFTDFKGHAMLLRVTAESGDVTTEDAGG